MVTLKKPDRIRAAGIVLHDDALLVMFRRKNGREYYTFPGGAVEKGESPEETVVREIKEETTIDVAVKRLCYELRRPDDSSYRDAREYFFLCAYTKGEPTLSADSIERKINDPEDNFFEPRWMKFADLQKDIPLFPTEVAAQLFHDIEHGFQNTPIRIEGVTIGG